MGFLGRLFLCNLALIITLAGCREESFSCQDVTDPACENYDPCYRWDEKNAEFEIVHVVTYKELARSSDDIEGEFAWVPLDSLFFKGKVHFRLLNNGVDSVHWKIGDDPRVFTGNEVFLRFNNILANEIEVRCVVFYDNTQCPLLQSSTDTAYQTLKFQTEKHEELDWPWLGNYTGEFSDRPGETFEILFSDSVFINSIEKLSIFGFGNRSIRDDSINQFEGNIYSRYIIHNSVVFELNSYNLQYSSTNVKNTIGLAQFDLDKEEVLIEFYETTDTTGSVYDPTNRSELITFRGRKQI